MTIGDYLSGIKADLYYYELGGNMRLRHTPEEFDKRANHIVRETRRKNPGAPIILAGVCELLKSLPGEDYIKANAVIAEFDKTLKNLAREVENTHYIESVEICSDRKLLCADGMHPSIYGNIQMGLAIYGKLKNLI
jgi:lysophospholipase L1-like esterase